MHFKTLKQRWANFMIKIETYAQALFEVVAEPMKVYKDIQTFKSLLEDADVLSVFSRNYAEPEVLNPLWETLDFSVETIRLLKILQADQRILDFDRFIESYQAFLVKYEYLSIADVRVASVLSETEKEKLVQMLKGQYPGDIELHIKEDQTLIKGMVVHINHDVIDTSLRNKLNQIKHQGGK